MGDHQSILVPTGEGLSATAAASAAAFCASVAAASSTVFAAHSPGAPVVGSWKLAPKLLRWPRLHWLETARSPAVGMTALVSMT